MSRVHLVKTPNGFVPATDEDAKALPHCKQGEVIYADFKKQRNYEFHKRFFALVTVAFDNWEAPDIEYNGVKAGKSFDRFRKDLLIMAGYFDVVSNIKGEVRAEAKSISFGKMEQEEFEKVYSDVLDVVLQKVLTSTTFEELENQIMRFL